MKTSFIAMQMMKKLVKIELEIEIEIDTDERIFNN